MKSSRIQYNVLKRSFELLEEAEVVLEIVAEVANLPLEHGDTLHTHSEGESAVLPAVDAGSFKDVRIHHAAAHDLEPAGSLAYVAALSAADVTAYVDLSRRLCEREVRRTHADLCLRAEHLTGKQEDSLLHVCECHVLIDVQAFDLMEDAVCAG